VTEGGIALYALADACRCPEFVMATLPELAELGIVGRADVLPVPVGPGPQAPALDPRIELIRRERTHCEADQFESENERPLHVWGPSQYPKREMCQRCTVSREWAEDPEAADVVLLAELDRLRTQITELLVERHSTNESLSDAAEQLRADRDRIAELEAGPALPWAHAMPDDDLHGFLDDLVSAAMGRWQSSPEVPDREVLAAVEKACAEWRTPGQGYRSDEDEPAPSFVYRAEHPDSGIVLGTYSNREAAVAHCEALATREGATGLVSWVPDDSDALSPEELTYFDVEYCDGDDVPSQTCTGYVVTPLEVASTYDPDADE
jgi:hypothetical protein